MAGRAQMKLAAGSGPTFGVDDLACAAATHLGCWADEGLDVTWTPVFGGVAAVRAILDGSVDAAYGGLGPVLKHRCEGHPVLAVVSMARALAQNLVVQKSITSVDQLRGKSWALDGFGALSHHMARCTIRALKIADDDIRWEAVGPPPERIARLLDGSIDVSLIRVEEAISLTLDENNELHTLLGFKDLKDLVPVQPHGVLSTRESYEAENPENLHKLAKGMIKASRMLNDDYTAFRKVYDHYVSVPVPDEKIQQIWQQERDSGGFAINGEVTQAHWDAQMESFVDLHPDLPRIRREDVIRTSYVESALTELGSREGPDALS